MAIDPVHHVTRLASERIGGPETRIRDLPCRVRDGGRDLGDRGGPVRKLGARDLYLAFHHAIQLDGTALELMAKDDPPCADITVRRAIAF